MTSSPTTNKDTKEPSSTVTSLLSSAARIIPGFHGPSTPTTSTKTRSRNKKSKAASSTATTTTANTTATDPTLDNTAVAASNGGGEEEDLTIEDKKTSAVEAVQKRIRAANKKLQRIVTYEEKTEALNEDQRRSIASKPTLTAIVKELEELLVILKAEETEDESRNTRVAAVEAKKQQRAVASAVEASKKESQNNVVLLLQFLRLHGLVTAEEQGINPPALPQVVADATANEIAAVRYLQDAFTNGPLLGGHGDAVEKIAKVSEGSDEIVLLDVTFARIRDLITGLTSSPSSAPPAELSKFQLEPEIDSESPLPESSAPATANDSVTALVDGATDSVHPEPSFLNASEIDNPTPTGPSNAAAAAPAPTPIAVPVEQTTDAKVASWADDVEEAAPPVAPIVAAPQLTREISTPVAPSSWGTNSTTAPGATAPIDWSSEDNHNELPSLPELAPPSTTTPAVAAPTLQQQPQQPQPESDGFQPARPSRRGSGEGGPRGGGRGGSYRGGEGRGRGGGGYRGGRGGGEGWNRGPREEGQGGGYRGRGQSNGEGRGRGGRGRGGPRGAAPEGTAAPAAVAAPAPAEQNKW